MATPFTKTDMGFVAEQSAGSNMDYGLDWSSWFALAPGDSIAQSSWTASPGLTLGVSSSNGMETVVWVSGGTPGEWYSLENTVVSTLGRRDTRTCLVFIKQSSSIGTALFPNRLVAIAKMRRDRLVLAAAGALPGIALSDDYLWDKLVAAEAHAAHILRVAFQPTYFFPKTPTADELAALPVGMPWDIDPAYDYNPGDYTGDKWGLISTRQKPIQSIESMRFIYPSLTQVIMDVPNDWLRSDLRYGHIQVVPSGTSFQTMMGGMFMSTMSGGRTLPFTVELRYIAGLANVAKDYPDLINAVNQLAISMIVDDAFLPQSGSISADGLSQSMSVDSSKYRAAFDDAMNGSSSNGGLMARIHGIRLIAL